MVFHCCFTSCKWPLDAFSDLYVRCVHYAVQNIRRTLVRTWNYTWHNLDIARGGTRYILGWGCAARPLIPWLCLRQKSLIFLPCLSRQNSDFWYRKSSIKPPGGLIFFKPFWGGGDLIERGGLKERGGLFNLAKRITCSKNTLVWDRVDLRIVQLKSPSKVFNSLVGA